MYKVFKLLSRITAFIFVAMLLYVYAFLPEMVGLYFGGSEKAIFELSREAFFYSSIILFVVTTVFLSYLKKSLKAVSTAEISSGLTESKVNGLQFWANGMSVMFNLFLVFSVSFVGMYHNDEHFNNGYFAFLAYLGPLLLIGWIFYLVFILIRK